MKNLFATYLLIILSAFYALAQADTTLAKENQLNVFIDGSYDIDHIKKEISYVNYVRDRKDADVHIIITSQRTGAGGRLYSVSFNGQKDYINMVDTIAFTTIPNSSEEEKRTKQIRTIKLGLMRYIAQTPMADMFRINYNHKTTEEIIDKWNSWVYKLNVGGYGNGEESYQNLSMWGDISADRITEDWKTEISYSNHYNQSTYFLDTETYKTLNTSNYFEGLVVKSMGEHWSSGGQIELSNSTFSNIKLSYESNLAIEYNIFPYSESTTKQLRIMYMAGYKHNDYIDTTLYDKISEDLMQQNLEIAFEYIDKWGSLSTGVRGSTYFHDFSKNSLNVNTNISLNIFKGLSVYLYLHANLIHNQLSLPKLEATQEEILLRQRQLSTNYSYYANFGISYTFGSIYNNVVNPRFGD